MSTAFIILVDGHLELGLSADSKIDSSQWMRSTHNSRSQMPEFVSKEVDYILQRTRKIAPSDISKDATSPTAVRQCDSAPEALLKQSGHDAVAPSWVNWSFSVFALYHISNT
mmetsp:Transcript_10412/g.22179  ORF Transcript_10412/g.22179 Transcript_10412/m.22179 type:complete len:112 (+) Transcript_10412:108-443(+)